MKWKGRGEREEMKKGEITNRKEIRWEDYIRKEEEEEEREEEEEEERD